VLVKQALLDVARRKVLVSDSSKYGKYGMFRVCSLAALDDIICDAALPPETQQQLQERGVRLHSINL
jgi:DeoR/GlpR family transcriptional regulator of sugar metabolism